MSDNDIVTRLRDRQRELEFWWPDDDPPLTWVGEAADEIEGLRAGLQDAWSAADMLATQLKNISSANTYVLRRYDMRREEACCD